MDKFGSHSRKRALVWSQDLDMNDNRITGLGAPREGSDAATRHWVNLQLKEDQKDIAELAAKIDKVLKVLEDKEKRLNGIEKDVAKCLPTIGGKMTGAIDMQGHAIRNLPEGTDSKDPVTNGWYAKNWQDLALTMQEKINAVESRYKTLEKQMADKQEKD